MKDTFDLASNRITIDQAKTWTKTWQDNNPKHSKAFLIPKDDILNVLQLLGVLVDDGDGNLTTKNNTDLKTAMRAYMAIGPDSKGVTEEKLVIVGAVDVKGEWQDQVQETKNTLKVSLVGSGAYDFTEPCPATCDPKSPLFHK